MIKLLFLLFFIEEFYINHLENGTCLRFVKMIPADEGKFECYKELIICDDAFFSYNSIEKVNGINPLVISADDSYTKVLSGIFNNHEHKKYINELIFDLKNLKEKDFYKPDMGETDTADCRLVFIEKGKELYSYGPIKLRNVSKYIKNKILKVLKFANLREDFQKECQIKRKIFINGIP